MALPALSALPPPRGPEPPAPPPVPAPTTTAPAPPVPNPNLRLDPALGLVVLEFRDAGGAVEATIPTRRELEAYRSAGQAKSPSTPVDGTAGTFSDAAST